MNIIPWLILMLVVVLGTIAQLSLKYAFLSSSSSSKESKPFRDLLWSRYFWLWFICYVGVTVLWLCVLRMIPLNQAFPFLGLTYALVPLVSHYFLSEKVIWSQWIGIAIIVAGVIFVIQK